MKNLQMETYARFRDWLSANPPCQKEVNDIIEETIWLRDVVNVPPRSNPVVKQSAIAINIALKSWSHP